MEPPNIKEAVKWFYQAALTGHVRAQYSLALCFQQGRGVECNRVKAVGSLFSHCVLILFRHYWNLLLSLSHLLKD